MIYTSTTGEEEEGGMREQPLSYTPTHFALNVHVPDTMGNCIIGANMSEPLH